MDVSFHAADDVYVSLSCSWQLAVKHEMADAYACSYIAPCTRPTSTATQHKIQPPCTQPQRNAAVICMQGETLSAQRSLPLHCYQCRNDCSLLCPCRTRHKLTSEVLLMSVQAKAKKHRFKRTHNHDKCRWRAELVRAAQVPLRILQAQKFWAPKFAGD